MEGTYPPKYECSVAGVVGFDKVIEKIERSGCPAHGVEFCWSRAMDFEPEVSNHLTSTRVFATQSK